MAEESGNIAYSTTTPGKIAENRANYKLIIENTLKI